MKTVFDKSRDFLSGCSWINDESPLNLQDVLEKDLLREQLQGLPQLSEIDVMRHFMNLSKRNFSVDEGFYPLGSCTMKYNPRLNEEIASLDGFVNLHPLQDVEECQGILELLFNLEKLFCEIAGMDAFSLQPAAGAHGEYLGLLLVRAYHRFKKMNKNKVLIPDSAHGTNPASANLTGYKVVTVKTDNNGLVDMEDFDKKMKDDIACFMLTNPNTLGLFENNIQSIAQKAHEFGALLYYDGANLNPLLGLIRPGDMGFDVIHVNTHKTFSTPHGGGGPGAGPVGVKKDLIPFLPVPRIVFKDNKFDLKTDYQNSVGRLHSFYGNVGVLIRSYSYIKSLGKEGLKKVGKASVINANYLLSKLEKIFDRVHQGPCMHEFVVSGKNFSKQKIRVQDIAKRLLDYGFHAPTVYFPLVVSEAMMVEPTETESKDTLDEFVDALKKIEQEIYVDPDIVSTAPHNTVVGRLDEAAAVTDPKLKDF